MRLRAVRSALAAALLILVASGCSGSDDAPAPDSAGRVLVDPDGGSVETASGGTSADGESGEAPGAIAFDADADSTSSGGDDDSSDGDSSEDGSTDGDSSDDGSTDGDSSDGDSTTGDPDGEDDASASTDSDERIDDTPLGQLTTELIAFVERERGLTFRSRPEIELLDNAAFGAAWTAVIAQDAAENSEDYANFTDIYRAMGVIDGDRTLEEIWTRFGDAGVIGFYDPDTGNIKLRSGEITAFTKTVLVHELVHALEDQAFGLDRAEYDDRTDEIDWTFSALTEGSARVIESRYRQQFTTAERTEEDAARAALPRTVSLSEFTTSFLELQFGRYRYGETFTAALWAEGQDAVDAAFENPPATSELILDPESFLRGTAPDAPISTPPADATSFTSGVWGEAAWAAVLSDTFDRTDALELADGWGGDAYVAWRTSTGACVRTHIAADTADELDDYAQALEAWARQQVGREVFYPTADIIRVTACG